MVESKIHNILGINVKCLTYILTCNSHLGVYETIEDYYDAENIRGLKTDEDSDIIQLQIYENTPVGFVLFTENSIEDLISDLKQEYEK